MLEACGTECDTATSFSPSRPAILFSERVKLQRIMGQDLRNREFPDSQPLDVGETSAGIDGYGTRESRAWCWLVVDVDVDVTVLAVGRAGQE